MSDTGRTFNEDPITINRSAYNIISITLKQLMNIGNLVQSTGELCGTTIQQCHL
jgi:hypothetical protein